jgi:phytoene synthase
VSETLSARLTRESGTSFYHAFRILPVEKREAIYAFYTFCRTVDDCVDEADGEGEAGLARWMDEVDRCYEGRAETPLGRELSLALSRYPIPRSVFAEIVEGCRMDLTISRYETEQDLLIYCRRVASAVGLGCIEIFGYRDPATREYAIELGLALQLTNIVRDVAADAARGRLYLPLADVRRFGLEARDVLAAARETGPARREELRCLLSFVAGQAEGHYQNARRLLPREDCRSLLAAEIMGAIYHALLVKIRKRGYPLAGPRTRLSKVRKIGIALGTAARVCWGIGR